VTSTPRILIGWREWVALPGLGLPAIKAKVDTGARTSALHAFEVTPFEKGGKTWVRFRVHPLQGRKDIVVTCEAVVVDYRSVSDSGGHREKRFVIETQVVLGSLKFPIEVTLANRETMSHRMLIGRSAMKNLMIDPNHVHLLEKPRKVASLYGAKKRKAAKPSQKSVKTKIGKHE
jgi:hypothetical protein